MPKFNPIDKLACYDPIQSVCYCLIISQVSPKGFYRFLVNIKCLIFFEKNRVFSLCPCFVLSPRLQPPCEQFLGILSESLASFLILYEKSGLWHQCDTEMYNIVWAYFVKFWCLWWSGSCCKVSVRVCNFWVFDGDFVQ